MELVNGDEVLIENLYFLMSSQLHAMIQKNIYLSLA